MRVQQELRVEIDGSHLSEREKEAVRALMDKMIDKVAMLMSETASEYVASRVKKHFNEIFIMGVSCGIALACGVAFLGHLLQ